MNVINYEAFKFMKQTMLQSSIGNPSFRKERTELLTVGLWQGNSAITYKAPFILEDVTTFKPFSIREL